MLARRFVQHLLSDRSVEAKALIITASLQTRIHSNGHNKISKGQGCRQEWVFMAFGCVDVR